MSSPTTPGGDGYESVVSKRAVPSPPKDTSPPPSSAPPAPPSRTPYSSSGQECSSPSAKTVKFGSPPGRMVSPYETVNILSQRPQTQKSSEEYCSPSGFGSASPPRQGGDLTRSQGSTPEQSVPRRPPKPGSAIQGSPGSPENVYQQPQAAFSREDIYDNFRLKNTPVSQEGVHKATADTVDSFVDEDEQDAGGRRKKKKTAPKEREPDVTVQEIDAGGMGCNSIEVAIQERRRLLETETEGGVVLLSVQKRQEENGKCSNVCLLIVFREHVKAKISQQRGLKVVFLFNRCI